MPKRYTMEQLATVFNDLLELSTGAQETWLAKNDLHPLDRQQLQRMLFADSNQETGFLDEPAILHAQALKSDDDPGIEPGTMVGKQFGSFRLTRLLGQGGMATVFMAERADKDFEQIAAIKLLKRGLFSSMEQKLFKRERRLLAQLNHPNIAHLIDGGVTEAGISYLVMEYVDGVRLDQYTIDRQLNLRDRLELFVLVCGAVDAAHQSLIVHRDLKPSNILVTRDGIPKLLDFGIAKLLLEDDNDGSAQQTVTAALTPGYAAPEQMSGKPITTAADVYALGVILHELLAGSRPNRQETILASNAIAMTKSVKPGILPMHREPLKRALHGDLDNIISRALNADPAGRYPTAAALIDDLKRYLEGRPVHAHPRSRLYAIRKFAGRHVAAVAIGTAFSFALLASFGVALWQANSARIETQRANAVRDFLLDLLDTAKANLPPDQKPTPAALASIAAKRMKMDTSLPELTRGDLLHTLGQVSLSAGAYDQAASMLKDAASIRAAKLGPEHADTVSTFLQLVDTRTRQGRYSDARGLLQSNLSILRRKDSPQIIDALALCASLEMEAGNLDAAFACRTEESHAANRLLEPNSTEALTSRLRLGDLLGAAQRPREAIAVLEPALSAWRKTEHSAEHADYLSSLNNLAVAYNATGELDKVIPILQQVLAARRRVLPANHPDIANSVANLGAALMGLMRYEEADALLKEALQISRAALGDAHPVLIYRFMQLSSNERRRNHMQAAVAYGRDAVSVCNHPEASSSSACPHAQLTLSEALRPIDAKESLRYADIALQQFQLQHKEPHSLIAVALHARAATLFNLQRLDESLNQSDASIAMFKTLDEDDSSDALVAKQTRALTLSSLGRHKEAAAAIEVAVRSWRKQFPARKDRLFLMLETRARIQLALGDRNAARAAARDALALGLNDSMLSTKTAELLYALSVSTTVRR